MRDSVALDDDTFREMARTYPAVAPVRELRTTLSQLRLNELAVGSDGRNRCLLSAFASKTGRNQPSNSRAVFGPSTWLRCLIRPGPGRAVAYVDWSQQELAIAARLSGDPRMQEAYLSGDFYLTFARMARAVPPDATKRSHGAVRDQFKTVALGVLYGLSAEGLSRKLLHAKAAMAKLAASEAAGRVVDRCVQLFGGRGYMREQPVERLYRDLRVDRIWEGTSEIQRLIVANEMRKRGLDGLLGWSAPSK